MERLPVLLLTGFLGSGKTTLILRWLRDSPATGLRMGVVMNEFGAESVDSQILNRPGLAIQQVDGGCLCCAPESELDLAMTRLAKSGQADYLVVETSGLADPDNVIDVLTDPDLLAQTRLQAVVTVVDALWYSRPEADPGERVLARKQIQFANVLCLSRCDLLKPEEIDFVEREVSRINPGATLVRLPFALPEIGALLARPPAERRIDAGPEGETANPQPHLHTGYRSITWRFPVPVDRSAFEKFLSELNPREVVRAKGFVQFTRQPGKLFLFQSVWGHHFIEEFPARPHPEPVAVLIGPGLDAARHQERLRQLMFGGAKKLTLGA
jgi:G3E family GTPase